MPLSLSQPHPSALVLQCMVVLSDSVNPCFSAYNRESEGGKRLTCAVMRGRERIPVLHNVEVAMHDFMQKSVKFVHFSIFLVPNKSLRVHRQVYFSFKNKRN